MTTNKQIIILIIILFITAAFKVYSDNNSAYDYIDDSDHNKYFKILDRQEKTEHNYDSVCFLIPEARINNRKLYSLLDSLYTVDVDGNIVNDTTFIYLFCEKKDYYCAMLLDEDQPLPVTKLPKPIAYFIINNLFVLVDSSLKRQTTIIPQSYACVKLFSQTEIGIVDYVWCGSTNRTFSVNNFEIYISKTPSRKINSFVNVYKTK